MNFSKLISVGKLGLRMHEKGFLLRVNRNFKPAFLKIPDVFLVFSDDRVRYVTLASFYVGNKCFNSQSLDENAVFETSKIYVNFVEKDVYSEITTANKVSLMYEKEALGIVEEEYKDFCDLKVYDNDDYLGKVIEQNFNGEYIVITVLLDDTEIMIPLVDEYFVEIDEDTIQVKNTEQLRLLWK